MEQNINYYHHDNTQLHRDFGKQPNHDEKYFCVMCKEREPLTRPEKRSVIVEGSNLAGCWTDNSFKIGEHVDMEIVVGGTVRDRCRAWRRQYEHLPEPNDVIAVLGINDVGAGQSVEEIMEEFGEFRDCVMRHSEEHKHEKKSTFAICTSIQPPKHMCFDEENPYHHLQNGKNKKAIIQSLNAVSLQV